MRRRAWDGFDPCGMTARPVLVTLLAALAIAAGPAEAAYRVGVGEQKPAMFETPAWQSLGLKQVRYLVPWDWHRTGQRAEVAAFMDAARVRGQDVLVTFTARRGCYDLRRYSRSPVCRAPGANAYRRAFRAFDDAYPWVRTYSAWNEVNHISQPTFSRPRLAVRYYAVLRRESRQFRYSEARAANRTRWMFRLADRYDTRRRGMRSKVTRLFVYRWFGEPPGAHFDAGLVNPDGSPRLAYSVFRRFAGSAAGGLRVQALGD